MPWHRAVTIPFTRIEVASQVPSVSGVYAVVDDGACLMVGESWNLKARLLGLANALRSDHTLQIIFETCPDDSRLARQEELVQELLGSHIDPSSLEKRLPGISFRDSTPTTF